MPPQFDEPGLYDLRAMRDLQHEGEAWLRPAFNSLHSGALDVLHLDAEDGSLWTLLRSQRWRFWRKPAGAFDA
jgi:hypothetical protein